MNEIKVEVGKFYFHIDYPDEKIICLESRNSFCNFYNYKSRSVWAMTFHHDSEFPIKPWKEEPMIGWVYDVDNSNCNDNKPVKVKIILDRNVIANKFPDKHRFIGVYLDDDAEVNAYDNNGKCSMPYFHNLKLETGRPDDRT